MFLQNIITHDVPARIEPLPRVIQPSLQEFQVWKCFLLSHCWECPGSNSSLFPPLVPPLSPVPPLFLSTYFSPASVPINSPFIFPSPTFLLIPILFLFLLLVHLLLFFPRFVLPFSLFPILYLPLLNLPFLILFSFHLHLIIFLSPARFSEPEPPGPSGPSNHAPLGHQPCHRRGGLLRRHAQSGWRALPGPGHKLQSTC